LITHVIKRDGRQVPFDRSRIVRAVGGALKEVGMYSSTLVDDIVDEVVETLENLYPSGTPQVEQVQDVIELTFMRRGLFDVAKAFILYRERKRQIREEKKKLLKKDTLSPTEKRFSLNAVRLLTIRYLWKDPNDPDKFLEDVEGLFTRVAVLGAIPEVLYDEAVFDKDGGHKYTEKMKAEVEEYRKRWQENPEQFDNLYKIDEGFPLNKYHFERLVYLYDLLAKDGHMKHPLSKVLSMLESGKHFDKAKQKVREFFEGMTHQLFMPNTPALVNAGRPLGMLSACFTVATDDSLDAIMDTAKEMAIIAQMGGGVGINLSVLRPKGDIVKRTVGVASGPISFLELYDRVLSVISQGGVRRGAGMAILEYWHPQVMDFIKAKEKNRGDNYLSTFNLSVGSDEHFWEAVYSDEEIDLINPRNKAVLQKIRAREILDKVAEYAWAKGDPAFLYFHNGNRYNIRKNKLGEIRVTNPCVTGDMKIPTSKGLVAISQLFESAKSDGHKVSSKSEDEFSADGEKIGYMTKIFVPIEEEVLYETVHGVKQIAYKYELRDAAVWKIGTKDTVKIITEEGYEVGVSATAKIMIEDGTFVYAKDLKAGQKIRYPRALIDWEKKGDYEKGLLVGWLVGDGYINEASKQAILVFSKNEKHIAKRMADIINRHFDSNVSVTEKETELVVSSRGLFKYVVDKGMQAHKSKNSVVPQFVFTEGIDFVRGFLAALFTADGYIDNDKAIRLTSSSKELLKGVLELLNMFGVKGKIYDRPYESEFTYTTKDGDDRVYKASGYYEIIIKNYSRKLFLDCIGFIDENKNKEHKKFKVENNILTVKEVVDTGKQIVYDITVIDGPHIYTPGLSIVKSNCGEEFLYPYESCNLASVNVEAFVRYDDEEKPYFDWEAYAKTIRTTARLLDNFVDVNNFPLDKIRDHTRAGRNIGVGIMGVANALFRLGIPYTSEEGYKFMERLAEYLTYYAMEESLELAKERGPFSYWEETDYKEGKLPVAGVYTGEPTLPWDKLAEEIKQYGIRNVDHTTAPPTGSVSMISDTSSGIEPLFSLVFKKVTTVGTYYYTNKVFEEVLRKRGMYDEVLLEKISSAGGSLKDLENIPEDLKEVFITAMDIHWADHVIAQTTFQKWITNSISKTINMANSVSVGDVKKAFVLAERLGAKGVTVYRDGSLDMQVYVAETQKEYHEPYPASPYARKVIDKLIHRYPYLRDFFDEEDISGMAPMPMLEIEMTEKLVPVKEDSGEITVCPVCGNEKLSHESGCITCPVCGWSMCTSS